MKINLYTRIAACLLLFYISLYVTDSIRLVLSLPHISRILWPLNDGDDWLNLVHARNWLGGGSFYDHVIHATNAPFGGMRTHWTSVINLLLAPVFFLLPAAMAVNTKLMISASILPPLLGIGCFVALLRGAARVAPTRHAFFLLAALALSATIVQYHFFPGRVDHHPLQMFLWCLIVPLCTQHPTPHRAFWIGLLLALSLWASVEALFFYTGICALFGMAAILRPKLVKPLVVLCASTAFFALLALLIEVRPQDIFSYIEYDSLSIVQVVFLFYAAALAVLLPPAFARCKSWQTRGMVSVGAVAALAACMLVTFPKFLQGPLVGTDPFIYKGLFGAITDAAPFFKSSLQNILWIITEPLLAVAVLYFFLRQRRTWRDMSMAFLLAISCAMMFIQIRWFQYVLPVAMFVLLTRLPLLMRLCGRRHASLGAFGAIPSAIGAVILATMMTGMTFKLAVKPRTDHNCYAETIHMLQTGGITRALGEKPLVLYIEPGLAGYAEFFTPYRVIAGYYHREGVGLYDLHLIATAKTAGEARKVLLRRHVSAMLVCRNEYKKDSWLFGPTPSWVKTEKRISPDGPTLLRLR